VACSTSSRTTCGCAPSPPPEVVVWVEALTVIIDQHHVMLHQQDRMNKWLVFRRSIANRTTMYFHGFLSRKGYAGYERLPQDFGSSCA
jgi:hypothetical protein